MDSQDKSEKLLKFIQKIKDEKKRISQLVEKSKYNQNPKKK